jgi:hypothetical protein
MKTKKQRRLLRKCETCRRFNPVKYNNKMFAGCRIYGKVEDCGKRLASFVRGECTDYLEITK